MTLLINYWKDKTAGESFTHVLKQEELYLDHESKLILENNKNIYQFFDHSSNQNIQSSSSPLKSSFTSESINFNLPISISPFHIHLNHDFKDFLLEWKQQKVPETIFNSILQIISQNNSYENNNSFKYFPSNCLSIAIPKQYLKYQSTNKKLFQQLQNYFCQSSFQSSKILVENKEYHFPSILVFHLKNTSLDSVINAKYQNYTLHNWNHWKLKTKEFHENTSLKDNDIEILPASTIEACREWKLKMPGGWIEPTD